MMLETAVTSSMITIDPQSANSSEVRLGPSPETLMTPGMIPAAATATTTGTAVRAPCSIDVTTKVPSLNGWLFSKSRSVRSPIVSAVS